MQAPSFLSAHAEHLEHALSAMLEQRRDVVSERLLGAMRYSLMAGGKRIRPALLMECYAACGGAEPQKIMPAAMAIEAIHTYSLIHDDLPCMDDDDLRRGNPTCHKQYDEATAVLAGDALQALAFELIAMADLDAGLRCRLLGSLALAAGCQGMVGGQMLDIEAGHGPQSDLLAVERIHLHKTGALLRWCCEAGALMAGADAERLNACSRFGKAVGLLFQIADDILDVTATTAELGKSAGKDQAQNKATYVSVMGLQRARELAEEMQELAISACRQLHGESANLELLVHYIQERGN